MIRKMEHFNYYPMKYKKIYLPTLVLGLIFMVSSCYFDGSGPFNRIVGEGPVVSEEFDLVKLRGIVIRNSADVVISQGDKQKIVVEAQRNIIDNLKKDVSNGIWYIGNKKPVWRTKSIQIRIRMADLSMVKVSGSGDISTGNTFRDLDDLEVRIGGSGDIVLSVEADDVLGYIGGSGSITIDGEANEVEFTITGSGSINAYDLEARRGYAKISGSGSIHVDVEDELDARISGSGGIYYKGSPRVDKHISGSGSIRSR